MNINQLIGANIKRLREDKHLKQSILAEKLNVSIQTISAIENGKQNITLVQLEKIVIILEIRLSFFFASDHIDLTLKNEIRVDCGQNKS